MKIFEKLKKKKLSPQDEKLLNDIEQYGLGIASISEDESGPTYSFSIGLFDNYEHPEIILLGLPQLRSQEIINNIALKIHDGNKFEPDQCYDGILKGYKCCFKKINKKYYEDYLGWAKWYYDGDNFPAIQCIWPDKNNLYPWDDKFSDSNKWYQPVLT